MISWTCYLQPVSTTGGLLKIEDVLPFFPDFVVIDNFRDAICDSLERYNKQVRLVQYSGWCGMYVSAGTVNVLPVVHVTLSLSLPSLMLHPHLDIHMTRVTLLLTPHHTLRSALTLLPTFFTHACMSTDRGAEA
jgi:hypothetical protein